MGASWGTLGRVTSVETRVGDVDIVKADVGLGNVTDDAQVKKIASSTDNAVPRFDGGGGDMIQDSDVIIDDTDSIHLKDDKNIFFGDGNDGSIKFDAALNQIVIRSDHITANKSTRIIKGIEVVELNGTAAVSTKSYDTELTKYALQAFYKSHQTSEGLTETVDGENIAQIHFIGVDGSNTGRIGAKIKAIQDGNATASRIPVKLVFQTESGAESLADRMTIKPDGNIGIGDAIPTAKLDINSDILRLRTVKTPASAGAAGNAGDICWDADFIYICIANATWRRIAHASW